MPYKLLPILVLLIVAIAANAQLATPTPKPDEAEKLKKASLEFLKETAAEVGRMRSVENRISFSGELASLLWYHDQKEAKAMYASAMNDLRQLLIQLDAQMNAIDMPIEEDYSGGMFFGPGGRSPVERKLRIGMGVRQQMALSIAEHDAETAYAFFYDSGNIITNEKFRKETEQQDKGFEFQLLKTIADSNATKAAALAAVSLKDGVTSHHIEILKKIYAKDHEKGIEFGQTVLSRLKSQKAVSEHGGYVHATLLHFGSESLKASKKPGAKKPVYTQSELRDVADLLAQVILAGDKADSEYLAEEYVEQIEEFSPTRAGQIRSKFRDTSSGADVGNATGIGTANAAMNSNMTSSPPYNGSNSAMKNHVEREAAEKKLAELAESLGKPLPKEEREKVVGEARKIIAKTSGIDRKIAALSLLAAQVARLGDKELADEVMRDAERLIAPNPKNYRDFLLTWLVAAGYAEANPAKAFPLLDDTIGRINDTISAAIKVAEFIDVGEEMVSDGEVQVGAFGGQMIRGMTRELGIANVTLMSLAKADIEKTKALTNRFDRVETRVLAKMLVLRAILDQKKPSQVDVAIDAIGELNSAPPPPPPMPRRTP